MRAGANPFTDQDQLKGPLYATAGRLARVKRHGDRACVHWTVGGANVIVTANLSDFPAKTLEAFGLEAAHPTGSTLSS